MRFNRMKEIENGNQTVADHLDTMWDDLTALSRRAIETTDINLMAELFGGLETAEQVNRYVEENREAWEDE